MLELSNCNELKSLLRTTNSSIALYLLNHHPHTRFHINGDLTIEIKNLTFSAFCDCVTTFYTTLENSNDYIYFHQSKPNFKYKFAQWFIEEIKRLELFNTCFHSSQTVAELRPIITPTSFYIKNICSLADYEKDQNLNTFNVFKTTFFHLCFKNLTNDFMSLKSKNDFEQRLWKIDAMFCGLLDSLILTLTQNVSEIDPRSELKAVNSLWGQLILPLTRFNSKDFSSYYYTNLLSSCVYSANLNSAPSHETLRIEMLSCAYDFFYNLHLKNKKFKIETSRAEFLDSAQFEIKSTQALLSGSKPSLPPGFWQKASAFINTRNYYKEKIKDKHSNSKKLLLADFFKTLQSDLSLLEQFVLLHFILGTSDQERLLNFNSNTQNYQKITQGIKALELSHDFLISVVPSLILKLSTQLSKVIKPQDLNPSLIPYWESEMLKKYTPKNFNYIEKQFKI